MPGLSRSDWTAVDVQPGVVFIVDNDKGITVTNDAENVVKDVVRAWPNRRIVYRDTDRQWSELRHDGAQFIGYATTDLRPSDGGPGDRRAYGAWCRNPKACAGKGTCPLDPTCGD